MNDVDAAARVMAPYFRPYADDSLKSAVEELRARIETAKPATAAGG